MKKITLIICITIANCLLPTANSFAQAPQAIPYQAVARDTSGNLITNQIISLRFSVHDVTAGGTVLYNETQSTTTNALGLFTVNIGQGTPVTGTFASINWGTNAKFLQVEMDAAGGSNYVDMGTQQMMSVPYALYAESSSFSSAPFIQTGIDTVASIPDNSCTGLTSSVTLSGYSTARSTAGISVTINITHPNDADLYIFLIAPDGSVLSLARALGTTGDNFINTTFSDSASSNISSNSSPFTGTFKPQGLITTRCSVTSTVSTFGAIGGGFINPNGTWSLKIFDQGFGNVGTLDNWSLYLDGSVANYVPKWLSSAKLSLSGSIYDNGSSTSPNIGLGTATPSSAAALEISSSNKGLLLPRLSTYQRNAISNPVAGLQIFNTDNQCINIYDGSHWIENCGLKVTGTTATLEAWQNKSDFIGAPRSGSIAFSIGTKGYIGTGVNSAGSPLVGIWEYDQATNVWTQKASLSTTGRSGAVGFSIGTKGYVGTGFNSTSFTRLNDFWEYDPATNVWTQKANFGGTARDLAVGFSIGSKGYIGTGLTSSSTRVRDFWEYDPATNIWTQKANVGTTVRSSATGFSIGAKGYIGTGLSSSSTRLNDFWEYDPSLDTWTQKTSFGGTARSLAVGFSIGTKGYIGTGLDATSSKNDFWEYDVTTNTWLQKTNLGGVARNSAVGFSLGTRGYVATGINSSGDKLVDLWELGPGSVYTTPHIVDTAVSVDYGTWTIAGNTLYNSNSGNVGIGTVSPVTKLNVEGNGSGTAVLRISNDNDATKDSVMVFTNAGNVGIGTTTPLLKLDSRGINTKATTASFENIIQAASTDVASPLAFRMGIKTDATAANRYGAIEVDDAGTKRNLVLQPASGNVGIGTTSPLTTLQIGGAGEYGLQKGDISPNAGYLRFGDNSGWKFHIGRLRESAGGTVNTTTTGSVMTVQDNGNVGIGTTSPGERLEVNGRLLLDSGFSADNAALVYNNNTDYLFIGPRSGTSSNGGVIALFGNTNNVTGNPNGIDFNTGAPTLTMRMLSNGNVGIGLNTPGAKLDIAGTTKIGTNGSVLTSIIKASPPTSSLSIAANTTSVQTYAVANVVTGSSVMVSPASALNAGLVIAYARVSLANTVEVSYRNTTAASITLSAGITLYITVIQ